MPQYGQPPEEKLAYRSLLRSASQQRGFGDQSASAVMERPGGSSFIDEEAGATQKVGTHMYSPTLTRQAVARTTSHVQVASTDIRSLGKNEADSHHLHMAWALVADRKGNPRPRVRWLVN